MTTGGRQDDRGDGGAAGLPDGTREDDLVALIYGELDREQEAALRARVAAEPALASRLAEMERVRELYRGLPVVEAPGRVSAQLLAQAAARSADGAAVGGRSGLWRRLRSWLQPIAAHPGLAAATSLLLVAGVAGLLLMREGDELIRTHHALRSAVSSEPVDGAARSSAAAAPGNVPSSAGEEEDSAGTGVAEGRANETSRTGAVWREQETEMKTGVLIGTGSPDGPGSPGSPGPSDERVKRQVRPNASKAEDPRKHRDRRVRGPEPGPNAVNAGEKREAAAVKEVPRATPKEDSARDDSEAGGTASPQERPSPLSAAARRAPPSDGVKTKAEPEVQRLHEAAAIAAAGRRCREVRSLGEKIRDLDAGYHDKVFVADSRLTGCLTRGTRVKAK